MNTTLPEYESVEAFIELLTDDERKSFTYVDLQKLNESLHRPIRELRQELESSGFVLAERPSEKRARGFQSNSHDRWQSYLSYGGSGWNQITGFAGQEG